MGAIAALPETRHAFRGHAGKGSMKRVGIAAALLALVLSLGLAFWLYRGSLARDIADIESRLVPEAALATPEDPATASALKLAPVQCERVFDLRANSLAHALKGDELDALWRYCERLADTASGLDAIGRRALP
jgi:hypothetical protein